MLHQISRYTIRSSKAYFSTSKPVQSSTNFKNFATAFILFGFVGSVYYSAISKMKHNDDLDDIIQLEEKLRHLNDNNNKLYTRIHELKLVEASMIRGDNNLLGNIDEQISIHNDISSNTVSINKLTHRLLFYKRNVELFIRRVNSLRDIILN
jgi:hypothetical protein